MEKFESCRSTRRSSTRLKVPTGHRRLVQKASAHSVRSGTAVARASLEIPGNARSARSPAKRRSSSHCGLLHPDTGPCAVKMASDGKGSTAPGRRRTKPPFLGLRMPSTTLAGLLLSSQRVEVDQNRRRAQLVPAAAMRPNCHRRSDPVTRAAPGSRARQCAQPAPIDQIKVRPRARSRRHAHQLACKAVCKARPPRTRNMSAATACTQRVGRRPAKRCPNSTAGTLAASIPRLVPATTGSHSL